VDEHDRRGRSARRPIGEPLTVEQAAAAGGVGHREAHRRDRHLVVEHHSWRVRWATDREGERPGRARPEHERQRRRGFAPVPESQSTPASGLLRGLEGERQPGPAGGSRPELSARERARIERQTAVVHDCQMPVWARQLMAEEVEELERQEIRGALLKARILFSVILRPPRNPALLTVSLPDRSVRTSTGFPRSARTSCDRMCPICRSVVPHLLAKAAPPWFSAGIDPGVALVPAASGPGAATGAPDAAPAKPSRGLGYCARMVRGGGRMRQELRACGPRRDRDRRLCPIQRWPAPERGAYGPGSRRGDLRRD
jgi:hypothetical protein